jgi:hypothetical protein
MLSESAAGAALATDAAAKATGSLNQIVPC